MKTVKRYDSRKLKGGTVTPQGYLKAPAYVSRVGVQTYRRADGSILRELRLPEEVFHPDSLATLQNIPVTNEHPNGLVDAQNSKQHMVGFTGEKVEPVENKFVSVPVTITDHETIEDIKSGKTQLSCGYTCNLDETPGEWEGERYDVVQRNIRNNHVATTRAGRAGPEVRIRLDADDAESFEGKELKTMKIKIDGKEYEVNDDAGAAINAELAKASTVANELVTVKKDASDKATELAALKTEKDQIQGRADAAESEVKKLKEKAPTTTNLDADKIKSEAKVLAKAMKVGEAMGVEKFDTLDKLDLMKEVIKKDSPDADLNGKSEHYIEARFDSIVEKFDASDKTAKEIGNDINTRKGTEEKYDSDDSRKKYIDRLHGKKPAEGAKA